MGYKLDEIVREYLIASGEPDAKRFRFQQMAINCLRDFHMDFSGLPSIVTLPISEVDTINLPSDYIKYTKIGICDCNGNLVSLGLNSDMCLMHDKNSCGSYIKPSQACGCNNASCDGDCSSGSNFNISGGAPTGLSFDGYTDNYRNGELMGRFFGLGGHNTTGSYKVNDKLGVIQIQGRCGDYIILEYLGDLSLSNGDFEVHPYLISAIKAWIRWEKIVDNQAIGEGVKQARRKDYDLARRLAIKRFNSFTLQEWLDSLRTYNMSATHF